MKFVKMEEAYINPEAVCGIFPVPGMIGKCIIALQGGANVRLETMGPVQAAQTLGNVFPITGND